MSSSLVEIRDSEEATAFLAAGACLARLGGFSDKLFASLARRVQALISESGVMPPPGVLADVCHLLLGGSFVLPKTPPCPVPELAKAVHLYEDRFLARLAEDPRLASAQDAIAELPDELEEPALVVFVARLFGRIGYGGAASISPAVARRAAGANARELLARGHAALIGDEALVERLTQGYLGLVDASRRAPALISPADVFLLECFPLLGDLARRVAMEQALEAADQLFAALPRRMKPNARAKRGTAPTKIQDEDKYPIGGFSAIATSGSLENMVTSELIYMDEIKHAEVKSTGSQANMVPPEVGSEDYVRGEEDIDLFDLRFVEGELLYFTRDESVFLRRHRELTFVFDTDLAPARVKDPGAPWQRAVMALGALACIARRAADWLREEDLRFRVAFAGDARGASEVALAKLLLRELIENRSAEVIEVEENTADYYFRFDLSLPRTFEDWSQHTREILQSIVDGA